MKILATGDWHGKIIEIKEKPDIIIYVGDFCPFDEIRRLQDIARKENKFWYELVGKEKAKEIVYSLIEEGKEVLNYLDSFEVPILIIPGNTDFCGPSVKETSYPWEFLNKDFYSEIIKEFDNIIDIHLKRYEFNGLNFVGYGKVFFDEEKLGYLDYFYKKLEKLIDENTILVSHNVPKNTKLDPKGTCSSALRKAIEEKQPRLCLCGHIHETSGMEDEIGRTKIINVAGRLFYFELKSL